MERLHMLDDIQANVQKSFTRMSAAEHLGNAKNALADGYKINSDPMKTVWGRISDAKKHLNAIGPEASQYITAQQLMDEALLRQKQIKEVCINLITLHMVKQRETLAKDLEQYFVHRGIDVDIELSEPNKISIKLICSVFRKASIDRIAYETSFFSHLKKAGFKNVVLGSNEENICLYSFRG